MADPNLQRNKLLVGRIAPAIMCCLALGNVLIAATRGGFGLNNLFVPAFASGMLLAVAGSLVFVTWQSDSGTTRFANLKNAIDAIAGAFVALFLLCPWWLYFYVRNYGDHRSAGGFAYLSLPLKVFLLDGPAFVAGLIWLVTRMTARRESGEPRVASSKIQLITFVVGILFVGAPLFLLRQLER